MTGENPSSQWLPQNVSVQTHDTLRALDSGMCSPQVSRVDSPILLSTVLGKRHNRGLNAPLQCPIGNHVQVMTQTERRERRQFPGSHMEACVIGISFTIATLLFVCGLGAVVFGGLTLTLQGVWCLMTSLMTILLTPLVLWAVALGASMAAGGMCDEIGGPSLKLMVCDNM